MKKTFHLGGRSVTLYFKLRCKYFLSKSKYNFSIQISHSTYKRGYINTSYASCMKIFLQGLKYIVLSTDGPINDQKPLNTSVTNRRLISCSIQSFLSPISSKITGNSQLFPSAVMLPGLLPTHWSSRNSRLLTSAGHAHKTVFLPLFSLPPSPLPIHTLFLQVNDLNCTVPKGKHYFRTSAAKVILLIFFFLTSLEQLSSKKKTKGSPHTYLLSALPNTKW